MSHKDKVRDTGQAPTKEFLALTHGQEWVNFYESFDKLVQDHLSRSSDLLKRAMSLPEVADREVAQVRAEMEVKVTAERERSRDLLGKLRDDLSASHTQVASLAESVTGVVGDLDSLRSRVATALASLDEPATDDSTGTNQPEPNGVAHDLALDSDAPAAVEADSLETLDVSALAEDPEAAADGESPVMAEFEAVAAAADAAGDPFESLDLSALAAAESGDSGAGEDSESDGEAVAAGGERPRPHWLSVTRIGSKP